jgi:uncharacterized protein
MEFLGRKEQIKSLNAMIQSDTQAFTLIYGRRRVGKSTLIKQCFQGISEKGIYYECKQTSEQNNVESLSAIVSEVLGFPKLGFGSMEELLTLVFNQAEKIKLVLVLDEYPYLRGTIKGLDSIIQSLIDSHKDRSKLKLILCGSYVDTMKSLLSEHNPLYGRVDLIIDLKQMDYYESSLFYPEFSNEDKIRLYSVFGGIPYYNRLIDSKKSVRRNIIDLIASPGARLENEVPLYLQTEIAKMVNANEVFTALAGGYSKFSDILSQSNVSSSPTLVDVLEKLIKMEVVKKEAPINDENNKKKAGYYICDNLSLFYYKYIFNNNSRLNIMDPEIFFDRYIEKDFENQYVPHVFESVCRQFLIRKNKSGKMKEPFSKIGKYYYDDPGKHLNGEFDVVTQDDNGYIFYEAKFRKEPVTKSMMKKEIQQVENTGLECYKYGFISRSGVKSAADECKKKLVLFTLKDLFE